jgi:hypothetical protein
MINNTKTAFKAIVAIALFASFIAIGCNDEKKTTEKESVTTDTGAAHPVTPVNRTDTSSNNTPAN